MPVVMRAMEVSLTGMEDGVLVRTCSCDPLRSIHHITVGTCFESYGVAGAGAVTGFQHFHSFRFRIECNFNSCNCNVTSFELRNTEHSLRVLCLVKDGSRQVAAYSVTCPPGSDKV